MLKQSHLFLGITSTSGEYAYIRHSQANMTTDWMDIGCQICVQEPAMTLKPDSVVKRIIMILKCFQTFSIESIHTTLFGAIVNPEIKKTL